MKKEDTKNESSWSGKGNPAAAVLAIPLPNAPQVSLMPARPAYRQLAHFYRQAK